MIPDLTELSDDELSATILLLGERAQEISNATTLVRQEQAARRTRTSETVSLGDFGAAELTTATEEAKRLPVDEVAEIAALEEAIKTRGVSPDGG